MDIRVVARFVNEKSQFRSPVQSPLASDISLAGNTFGEKGRINEWNVSFSACKVDQHINIHHFML